MKYVIISNPRDRISTGSANLGSVAIVSLNLARQLAPRHDLVIVAARGPAESEWETLAPHLRVLRVTRRWLRLQKYRELAATAFDAIPPYFLSPEYCRDFYRQAADALRQVDPDVIHIQNYGQAAAHFREACPRARIVVHLHDSCLAQVSRAVAHRILNGADLVVTCSDHVTRSTVKAHPWLKTPIVTINNGVDISRFKPRGPVTRSEPVTRITYVGRLSPEKGLHILVAAFNKVIERAPQARLELVGGASMFSYAVVNLFRRDPHWASLSRFYGSNPLQRLFRQLFRPGSRYVETLKSSQSPQAAQATQFHGEQPHDRISETMAAADIIAVPSVCDEPFGIPAVEGMAAGIPVVAAAAGGLCDIVEDGKTGLLAPRSDAAALADAILELIANPARRAAMGREGRSAAERFTWERAGANLLDALERSGIPVSEPVKP